MNRPERVVQIQSGNRTAQIHAGGVIGIQSSNIAPVRNLPFRFSRNPIVTKVIGVDPPLANKGWEDIAPKIVSLYFFVFVFLQ